MTAVALLTTTAGCAVVRDRQTVGAHVDDATLTARVVAKFAEDPTVSAMAISVQTFNGPVQLSGFARSADERAGAESLSRNTSGVKAVTNDIAIRGRAARAGPSSSLSSRRSPWPRTRPTPPSRRWAWPCWLPATWPCWASWSAPP